MGQVFAIHGMVPSLIIWLAVALYNPLLAALSAAGALMGSFIPLLLLGNIALIYSNHKQSTFPCQTLTTISPSTMDCGDTAPSSPSPVSPGQLLHSQGKFEQSFCDLNSQDCFQEVSLRWDSQRFFYDSHPEGPSDNTC